MQPKPVCLLTDFGTQDPYVGIMKSVIQSEPPYPPVIDLTHDVPPQDERTGAFLLEYALPDCPKNAVVLVVVDPGVGTDRRIIAVKTEAGRTVVAPDTGMVNGLEWSRARNVTNGELARNAISSTFHGRDWFAPVGRYLSLGKAFEGLGPPVEPPASDGLVPDPEQDGEVLIGEIVHVDRFGNLISNVRPEGLKRVLDLDPSNYSRLRIDVDGRRIEGIASTYGDTEGMTGVIGSFERLEIAVPGGSARDRLQVGRGTTVKLTTA